MRALSVGYLLVNARELAFLIRARGPTPGQYGTDEQQESREADTGGEGAVHPEREERDRGEDDRHLLRPDGQPESSLLLGHHCGSLRTKVAEERAPRPKGLQLRLEYRDTRVRGR